MLKGHAKIELTDVKTGKVKKYEHDNMFTNALETDFNNKWVSAIGDLAGLDIRNTPIEENMLGGIALFSDTIEENANIINFPNGNEVVGYAGTIVNPGTDPLLGSRNLNESIPYNPETHSVTYVWDFTTAQGNGEISAIGLTDGNNIDYYGINLFDKRVVGMKTVENIDACMGFDYQANMTRMFNAFKASQNPVNIVKWDGDDIIFVENKTGSFDFIRTKIKLNSVGLHDNIIKREETLEPITVNMPSAYSNINYKPTYWIDGDDGYYYGFISMNNSSFTTPSNGTGEYLSEYGGIYLQIIKVNKNTFSVEVHNVTLPSFNSRQTYAFPFTQHPIITNDYILFRPIYNSSLRLSNTGVNNIINGIGLTKINKLDFTVSIDVFKDKNEEEVLSYGYVGNTTGNANNIGYRIGIYLMGQLNMKLNNGTYQMNDFVVNDAGVVLAKCPGAMRSDTKQPENYIMNVDEQPNRYFLPFLAEEIYYIQAIMYTLHTHITTFTIKNMD